jgi:8-oxo-dGTP pyrophosphatase MutT (NUDIX family)
MRKKLTELLGAYQPSFEETPAKEKMLRFIAKYPNCFERSLEVGHITASSWLLSRDGERALLRLHAKLGIWVQPGGHADGNPELLSVAIREAQEESGIQAIEALMGEIFDLDVHTIPANKREKAHLHYDVRFLLQVASDEELVPSHESKKLQWYGKNPKELPTKQRSILRMHEKWVAIDLLKYIKI